MEAAADRSRWSLALLLAAWLLALVGYFGPWVGHRSAALAWNAYDLFNLLRLLSPIETGALVVNLYALRLPLVGLALWLPLLLSAASRPWSWAGGIFGAGLALATLPSYPEIVGAWVTPGWRVPFWWGVGGVVGALALGFWGRRLGRARPWLGVAWGALTGIPAWVTLFRLLPALSQLHATAVRPGWGFWCAAAGWWVGMAWLWWQGIQPEEVGGMESLQDRLAYLRDVKSRHEAALMRKANVVGVGVGMRIQENRPVDGPGIVVNVTHKVPLEQLAPADRIPNRLDGVPVWVQEVEALQAQADSEGGV